MRPWRPESVCVSALNVAKYKPGYLHLISVKKLAAAMRWNPPNSVFLLFFFLDNSTCVSVNHQLITSETLYAETGWQQHEGVTS